MGHEAAASTALTIGNFDGVHAGHQALVHSAREAVGSDGRVVAVTFDPHPRTILRPGTPNRFLCTLDQRRSWLLKAGADEVAVLPTSEPLLAQTANEFLSGLTSSCSPAVIVEGVDFRFGKDRHGDINLLQELGEQLGYRVKIVDPVHVSLLDQQLVRVSSSMVRQTLWLGRVGDAARLLGRPYMMRAEVVQGDRMGRTLGVPTANLDDVGYVMPADGVYAGLATTPAGSFIAAISVGTKPTFGGERRFCEAHLVDFDGPLNDYGWELVIEFHHWLRDQLHFDDVDALVDQMRRDIERARTHAERHIVTGAGV